MIIAQTSRYVTRTVGYVNVVSDLLQYYIVFYQRGHVLL